MVNPNKKEQINILVVGDWMIDQHWVCGVHRSSASSRTGKTHLRCLNMKDGAVDDLCGAGATASVIYRALSNLDSFDVNLTGIGIWNKEDTDFLSNILVSAEKGRTLQPSGQIKTKSPNTNMLNNIRLVNIADEITAEQPISTTRIVRIYKHSRSNMEHLSRIDWETPVSGNAPYWITDDHIADSLVDDVTKDEFHAVVIKCLGKGVVSPALIKSLRKKISNKVPWFISSKKWINNAENDLLEELKEVPCRLFIIPDKAVDEAKRDKKTTKWLTSKGYETEAALDKMDELRTVFKLQKKPSIMAFPAGHMTIALNSETDDEKEGSLIIQRKRDTLTNPFPISTPFASIMFGSLVAMDVYKSKLTEQENRPPIIEDLLNETLEKHLRKSLTFARKYIELENKRVTEPDEWDPKALEPKLDLASSYVKDENTDIKSKLPLKNALDTWKNAYEGLGTIKKLENKDLTLELSRASVEVDDYICLDTDKKNTLQYLVNALEKFRGDSRGKSASCLIKAPPGSGKTRLAKSLAKSLGYDFLDFNITLMNSRNDIIDMFDRIVTEQANQDGKPLIVFVDEINTSINSQPVYSSFLAPLEDSVYVRAEKKFHIDPCFWIFAGTIKNGAEKKEKWKDFNSRLTLSDIELLIPEEKKFQESKDEDPGEIEESWYECGDPRLKLKRLEMVYIGSSVLISTFDDIREISEKVLFLFWILGGKKDMTIRQFVQFVKGSQDIQQGRVISKNINTNFLDRRGDYRISWGRLMDLKTNFEQKKGLAQIELPEEFGEFNINPDPKKYAMPVKIFEYWNTMNEDCFIKIKP